MQRGDAVGHRPELESERFVLGADSASRPHRWPAINRPPLTRCAVSSAVGERRGRPQRRARDERAELHSLRLRRDRAEQREALERAAPRCGGSPRHRWSYTNTPSSPAASAALRDRDRDLGIVDERRQREPELHASRQQLAREHRGADRAGALAERGGHDRDLGPVLRRPRGGRGTRRAAGRTAAAPARRGRRRSRCARGRGCWRGPRGRARRCRRTARAASCASGSPSAAAVATSSPLTAVEVAARGREDRWRPARDATSSRAMRPSAFPTRSPPSARARRTRTSGRRARR